MLKYIDIPSVSLDYNRPQELDNIPYRSRPFWYPTNGDQDDSIDDQRSNLLANYLLEKRTMEHMNKRWGIKQS